MAQASTQKNDHEAANDSAKSTLISRNITVMGRRTSIRLEPEMWMALREAAKRELCTMHDICTLISFRKEEGTSLTSAIRVFLMLYFRAASTEEGHIRAGHGNFKHMRQRARLPAMMPAAQVGGEMGELRA
ncbi:MAG: ribbon-helix-helix domain-containing protein [Alphaproteobacteria bacterium]|nr:ribbon-helix-helix domain-containing protein [Alphaproteobacteria bacterium]